VHWIGNFHGNGISVGILWEMIVVLGLLVEMEIGMGITAWKQE